MNKKRLIATFCIFLIVMLPISMAQDEFEETGETLIIEAKQYEPEILRSDYMEQLNIPVRVILGAIRGEPISLPENIKLTNVRFIKKQDAQKKNASVEGTPEKTIKDYVQGSPKWHKAPYPTLDNLGYVEITLKKIEKETEVPKQIDLDLEATLTYEAEIAGFTIGGENQKELKIATVETIKENPEEYKILGGRYYLRVTDITSGGASVEILDQEFKRLTSKSLKLGEASSSITLKDREEAEPDHIRLKLEEVRGVGDVKLELKIGDKLETKTFQKNKEIERGWKISNYYIGTEGNPDDDYIILQNKEFKAPVILATEDKFNEIDEIKKLIEKCDTSECKIYADSRIQNLQTYPVNRELFTQSVNSLEGIGLIKLVSVGVQKAGRLASIEIGGLVKSYAEGDELGTCGCKISSISRNEVRISGVKKCNTNWERDIETLKTGESRGDICRTVFEIKEITTDEKALITVLPGMGRGKTTTYFSVHIPVEKRLIQYTPEELQEKINKTEATIKKLDNTINQLQKLVEGWTKVCLATMAVFTVMAFLQGMGGKPSKTGTGTGAGTGTPTKTEAPKVIDRPADVKAWSELEYGYKSGVTTGYKLKDSEAYYFINGNEMVPKDEEHLGIYVGAKLRHKKDTYVLTPEGTLIKGTDKDYWNWGAGQGSGKYTTSFSQSGGTAVGIQSCDQIPPSSTGEKINYRTHCKSAEKTYGSALVLEFSKEANYMAVWSIGKDGKFRTQDDIKAFDIPPDSSTFRELKKDLIALEDANKRGEKVPKFRTYEYPNTGTFASGGSSGDVDCRMVMSEGQCKILFNACDPVMCPPSRCNFGGKVRNVENVIQSGLIGSLLLCLPNIKEGVIMPVCLSGILASLKTIRSVLQGYVDCLKTALNDQKSVGICDRIRSIWMCQILWKEAMAILNLAGGNLFDKAVGSGGGEYLTGLKGGVDNAKQTVDYFTNSYAKSIFASYTGRSSKEIGAVICEKAIYGKGPLLGDIVEDVTKAQNPTQFMAYVEEEALYKATEQKSTYKLYYHIYAGAQPIDYKVYVKQSSTGKTFVCKECSGTLEAEGYIDKSTLFTLEPKYNIICVKIGSKEECNMGRVVSTSFGVNAANNYLSEYELSKDITTEDQCRADVRGIVPNVQIEKTCSTNNPGNGKGGDQERLWKKVGTCGKNKEGAFLGDCWMKLGELEKYNPEAYKEITENLCKGTICEQYQSCTGLQETTKVSGYKTVICCLSGECKESTKHTSLIQTFEQEPLLQEPVYKEMYDKGKSYCESTEVSNNDPFATSSLIPSSWIKKEQAVGEMLKESPEKNQFYYFKGVLYLICGNCDKAREEFNKITPGDYFTKACGENTVEKGGMIFNRCSVTCLGKKVEEKTTEEGTGTPAATKVLKQTKITIITPSNKDGEPISISDAKEIKLTTGGAYTVKDITFYESVKSCYFNFGTDLTNPQVSKIVAKVGTTICKFGDTGFSIVGEAEGLKIEIGGVDEKSGEEFAYTFDVKVLEKSADTRQILLCKAEISGKTYKFCLEEKGMRCHDYYHSRTGTFFSHVITPKEYYTDTLECEQQCDPKTEYCLAFNELSSKGIVVAK